MKGLGIVILILIISFQLAGCNRQNPTENDQNSSSSLETPLSERTPEENNVKFSYLEQLTVDKQEAFKLFRAERDLKFLFNFTPEDMVIIYLYCLSIGDPDLLFTITYNGSMLPDQDTFRKEYFEYAMMQSSETAVHYRHYDSIEVDQQTAEDNKLTVLVKVGVGSITDSLALGLQKEDKVWKLDIYHLIENYKKQANKDAS